MSKYNLPKNLARIRNKLNSGIASKPLSKKASPLEKIKFRLCEKFVIYKNTHKLSQRELANIINIDEALMSKILHYHFDNFTVDRFVRYLEEIYPNLNLKVS